MRHRFSTLMLAPTPASVGAAGQCANWRQDGSVRQCFFHAGLPLLVMRTTTTSLRRTEQSLSAIGEVEPEPDKAMQ
jgi:hypothetical protein